MTRRLRYKAVGGKWVEVQPFGLGDAVALVAQPIAGALDRVLGTNIKRCGACAKRREALNRMLTLG